jgi:DNA-binding NarL/FixJ family response regulator
MGMCHRLCQQIRAAGGITEGRWFGRRPNGQLTAGLPRMGDGRASARRGYDASRRTGGSSAPDRMTAKRHSVLLVEDDEATRARLARAIETRPELRLSAVAASCGEAVAALDREAPDVLLTDLGLPDGSGIDVIREVRRRRLATESMAITVFGDERHVVAAIEAGATGYLLKDGSSEYVTESILQLLAGGSPISPPIARHLLTRFRDEPSPSRETARGPVPSLTEREREVLLFLVKGFTGPEIGGFLGISGHTVASHVKNIYRKLEVRSRGEAVYEAMQLGLVKEQDE